MDTATSRQTSGVLKSLSRSSSLKSAVSDLAMAGATMSAAFWISDRSSQAPATMRMIVTP